MNPDLVFVLKFVVPSVSKIIFGLNKVINQIYIEYFSINENPKMD
jgi:hypothetical protein